MQYSRVITTNDKYSWKLVKNVPKISKKHSKNTSKYSKYLRNIYVKETFKYQLKNLFVCVTYSENVSYIFRKILIFPKIPGQIVRESVLNKILLWKTYLMSFHLNFGAYFTENFFSMNSMEQEITQCIIDKTNVFDVFVSS